MNFHTIERAMAISPNGQHRKVWIQPRDYLFLNFAKSCRWIALRSCCGNKLYHMCTAHCCTVHPFVEMRHYRNNEYVRLPVLWFRGDYVCGYLATCCLVSAFPPSYEHLCLHATLSMTTTTTATT